MNKKRLTVDILREKIGFITPPERLLSASRRFTRMKANIKKALEDGAKSIPQIAKIIGEDPYEISWFIATLLRHGVIKIVGKDDEDRYIFEWVGEEL